MARSVRSPLISIPDEVEGFADFRTRVIGLLAGKDTHVYIDTSFLMWLTKIGSGSRQELFAWLRKNCLGRVHVPIWAAHEYLKHYVAGTIVNDLADKTSELADLVGRTYAYFRPFVDEPVSPGAEDPSTIRAETRSALTSLARLTRIGRQWQKSYQKHSAEVITFINASIPDGTSIYDDLQLIAATGAVRFAGSVPPGFEDRRKKGSAKEAESYAKDDTPVGSNRYGDLSFWREVLAHAKEIGAKVVLILTNERKNDWHLGRSSPAVIDPQMAAVKRNWKPLPRPHPMLALEAKLVAAVEQLELLDSLYLAALLRESSEQEVRQFSDVAIVPDEPESIGDIDKKALGRARLSAAASQAQSLAVDQGHLFADSPLVHGNSENLARALFDSRQASIPGDQILLEGWRASAEAKKALIDTLSAETFRGLNHKDLVRIARELHDRVLQKSPGNDEALADLVSILDRLPPNTAGALYLGLLASMYLARDDNRSRLPPSSPVAQLLFDRQSETYATNAIRALAKRLTDNEFRPLYIPRVDRPPVLVTFDTESETSTVDQLRSFKIGEVELLVAAQADNALRLTSIFETSAVEAQAVIRKACQLFSLPEKQIQQAAGFRTTFTLTEAIGFKRPVDIAIPKERPLGK